jgi:murein L,D-transpeptidase YcbB/YkuD
MLPTNTVTMFLARLLLVLIVAIAVAASALSVAPATSAHIGGSECKEKNFDHPPPTLSEGDTGQDVKHLQCLLNDGPNLELLIQKQVDVEIDGDFGPVTKQAVKQIQSDEGIDVDGAVGPCTWDVLHTGSAAPECYPLFRD